MMRLQKIIEELRGKPYPPSPTEEILACTEISDANSLCVAPLVSVIMITYNHEAYIKEAVESIMAQDAPFEYELLIGEDCSADRTRVIATQLQRKYPNRIRLFYSEFNIGWNYNIERLRQRARGAYIAWCEGDDYWIDSKKLDKQIALLERTSTVISFAFNNILLPNGALLPRTCKCKEIIRYEDSKIYFHLSTYIIRADVLSKAHEDYPNIPEWYDTVMMPILATYGKISVLPEIVSVYRITNAGIATSLNGRQRRIREIDEKTALYLYGPKVVEQRALLSIFRESILYFYLRSSNGRLWTREGRLVISIFFCCLPHVFYKRQAWKFLINLLLSFFGIRH